MLAQVDLAPAVGGTLRAVGGALIVLGIVMALAWLARRGALRFASRGSRPLLTLEAATPLGERRSLVVVNVEGRRLLLGLTPSQVSLVTELTPTGPDFDRQVASRLEGSAS